MGCGCKERRERWARKAGQLADQVADTLRTLRLRRERQSLATHRKARQ